MTDHGNARPDDGRILGAIDSPEDLKGLTVSQLEVLAKEIRERIIEQAAKGGGHLAPHLGVVELTLALHYIFHAPHDNIIWDVGHQCYAHKLITGRRDQFETIRSKDGLSGYPKRCESPYDVFGVGHSSTSISAGLGLAVAAERQREQRKTVAVIGDGSMTAGMAFEALSHAGHLDSDLIVVLNDNQMSISPSVGALSSYFSRLITGGFYNKAKGAVARVLGKDLTRAASRIEHGVKGIITPGTVFEELGFRYIGPVDGHDIETLVECLSNIERMDQPILFHCVTQKGKGYSFAERDPLTYHGVKAFDVSTGQFNKAAAAPQTEPVPTFTDAFAASLIERAKQDERVVAITAAMATGTGLAKLEEELPGRVYDVAICEQHAVTFAAGLAAGGQRPVCAIYSTFLQRAYDQVLHDVCMQGLPVVFAIDRAGAVGEDSPTQQGAFDLTFLRSIPGLTIAAPRDAVDTRAFLPWALEQGGPVAYRYGRCKAPVIGPEAGRDITRGEVLREGTDGYLVGIGPILGACMEAAERLGAGGLSVGVVDARFVKPLDGALLDTLSELPVITVEENTLPGGFGSAVLEYFQERGRLDEVHLHRLGFPDAFMNHATRDQQLAELGLDAEGIAQSVRRCLGVRSPSVVK